MSDIGTSTVETAAPLYTTARTQRKGHGTQVSD